MIFLQAAVNLFSCKIIDSGDNKYRTLKFNKYNQFFECKTDPYNLKILVKGSPVSIYYYNRVFPSMSLENMIIIEKYNARSIKKSTKVVYLIMRDLYQNNGK